MNADIRARFEREGIYCPTDLGTHRTACPECKHGRNDTALSVTIEDGGAVWHCFRCGFKGGCGRTTHHDPATKSAAQEQAAQKAAEIIRNGRYASDQHSYLQRKRIKMPWRMKVDGQNRLIIPMFDIVGELWNVQTIAGDGTKLFLKGGRKKGCFQMLGEYTERAQIVIAEGFATAASIREAANSVPVAIAFDCGNLESIARALRIKYPEACIVLAADDDYATDGNPGLTKARAAAELIGGAVAVPEFPANGGSRGTDFNDMCAVSGHEAVHKIIHAALDSAPEPRQPPEPEQQAERFINIDDFGAASQFQGPPPPIEWLVDGSIPLGVPVLLAAMGGVGKSFITLQLGLRVATPPIEKPEGIADQFYNLNTLVRPILGGPVVAHGKAVIFTAEDNKNVVHRRIVAIDPEGRRTDDLKVIPLPSAGGPLPLFVQDRDGTRTTAGWDMIRAQLLSTTGLRLIVFDPLAAFAQVPLDADSPACQFVMTTFAQLAEETGATVIVSHHMRKANNGKTPQTPAEAREAIRGSTALVDGVRLAYALWPVDTDEGEKVCKDLGLPIDAKRVVKGAIVKTNEIDGKIATYVRSDGGLLVDRTSDILNVRNNRSELLSLLEADLAWHAEDEMPLQHTGKGSGVYECRECLHPNLSGLGRDHLQGLCKELIDSGRIVKCRAQNSTSAVWLDVPDGPFTKADGEGTIRKGSRTNRHPK
jgi:hypothetical protein